MVIAHAMGRTLVIPPQQHLYLLGTKHKDEEDKEEHDEMGFEDFFDIPLLESHKGFHVMKMKEFLQTEAIPGKLNGRLPPENSTELWGDTLWSYLGKVADVKPKWTGRFMAFPDRLGDFNLTDALRNKRTAKRYKAFGGDRLSLKRETIFYDRTLQNARHIHIPKLQSHRVLQHHYGK